ncbi:hypothetical protein RUM44_001012 [Polyplax serrata]|uniref:Uncharacterized protein n=1 Tax=Polyplax serrata TaxID=468196 RepID=A0ABR1B9A9_POLSC
MATAVWSCGFRLRFKFSPEEIGQRSRSLAVDKMVGKHRQKLTEQVKLLLLGAGESGKSRFVKEMRITHGVKFERELLQA